MKGGLRAWLEERTGYQALVHAAFDEPIPGGARPRYVFGSVLVFLFVNQLVTGGLLALSYAPSVKDAWASVAYLQELSPAGWFFRGMHSVGASACVCVVVLHLLQVTWAGAYRRPREVTWWVGLMLLGLLLAFGLTGYLLPWDQKGYFATQVATSILGATPLVGPSAQRVLQGGSSYGNLTLTHFYALHVIALPAAAAALIGLHVLLFRRHGVTPPAGLDDTALAAGASRFYPGQLALDLGAVALCGLVVVARVLGTHGVGLEAPADPTSSYEARPEWYFLPLFQLLRHLPGSLEIAGALAAPLVAGAVLFALPFLDRAPDRAPRRRVVPLLLVATLLVAAAALGITAELEDRRDPAFVAGRQRAVREAEAARLRFRARLGAGPADDEGRVALGAALFDAECSGCHVLGGRGEPRAPTLEGWSSRAWLAAFLAAPDDARFFGPTDIHGMKPVAIEGADRDALVEWLWALGGEEGADAAKVARGAALFDSLSCGDCHEKDGSSDGGGVPNLGGRAGARWIGDLIRDAGAPHLFGRKNQMPRFADKLTDVEVDALVALLRRERLR